MEKVTYFPLSVSRFFCRNYLTIYGQNVSAFLKKNVAQDRQFSRNPNHIFQFQNRNNQQRFVLFECFVLSLLLTCAKAAWYFQNY